SAFAEPARIAEIDRGARALQQGLGDEKPEAEAAAGLCPLARRHIGLADAVDDLGREARSVVGDGEGDLLAIPVPADGDGLLGEVDGVLDQVAEPIDDTGAASPDRLRADALARTQPDRDAEIAVRRRHL